MKLFRRIIIIIAWMPVAVALALIWLNARSLYPRPFAYFLSRLYREPSKSEGITYISHFDRERDFEIWHRSNAKLFPDGEWGRIVFEEGKKFPGIRISDYELGPRKIRDWSVYRWLKWDMLPLKKSKKPLSLTLKDDADRRFTMAFSLFDGTVSSITLDLSKMVPWIDLTRMADIHFYIASPEENIVIDMKDLRLEKGGMKPGEIPDTPFVVFEGFDAPARARLDQTIDISLTFSLTRRQDLPYSVFVHLFHEKDKEVEIPSRRAGYIHVEKRPFVPVTKWKVGEPERVGPFSIHLPEYNPPGRYIVTAGLFNIRAGGNGPRGVRYEGAFDYNGTFPKCRYTDPKIKDFEVGSIAVEAE